MYVEILEKGAENWDEFELVMGSSFRLKIGKEKESLTEEELKSVYEADEKIKELAKRVNDERLKRIIKIYTDAIQRYPVGAS